VQFLNVSMSAMPLIATMERTCQHVSNDQKRTSVRLSQFSGVSIPADAKPSRELPRSSEVPISYLQKSEDQRDIDVGKAIVWKRQCKEQFSRHVPASGSLNSPKYHPVAFQALI
jgi:hypothetical protein